MKINIRNMGIIGIIVAVFMVASPAMADSPVVKVAGWNGVSYTPFIPTSYSWNAGTSSATNGYSISGGNYGQISGFSPISSASLSTLYTRSLSIPSNPTPAQVNLINVPSSPAVNWNQDFGSLFTPPAYLYSCGCSS